MSSAIEEYYDWADIVSAARLSIGPHQPDTAEHIIKLADAAITELEVEVERLKDMLHVAWQRSGEAWNWPEDEWLKLLEKKEEPCAS